MTAFAGLIVWQLVLFVCAAAANTLSAMAGGGAGLVQLPMLIFFGLPFTTAVATHKIATVALGIGASFRHLQNRTLERRFMTLILVCGLPGVFIGANSLLWIPETAGRVSLGILTVVLGVYSIRSQALGQNQQPRRHTGWRLCAGGGVLFLLGALNGSLTSGTGLFVTLWLVHWFGFDYKRAVAYTLVLVGLFWNGTGAVTLALLTEPQWSWLPALLVGSAIGGYLGASLAITKGNPLIKRVFESVTIIVGLSLILTGLAR